MIAFLTIRLQQSQRREFACGQMTTATCCRFWRSTVQITKRMTTITKPSRRHSQRRSDKLALSKPKDHHGDGATTKAQSHHRDTETLRKANQTQPQRTQRNTEEKRRTRRKAKE